MNENEIKTLDLGEASALLALGYNLLRLEPTHRPKQRAFIFDEEAPEPQTMDKAQLVIHDYRRKKLQVDAHTYFAAIKDIKNRLHDELAMAGEV